MAEKNRDTGNDIIQSVREDKNLSDFQKKQLIKILTSRPEGPNEDDFLNDFHPDIVNFMLVHYPAPVPKYMLIEEVKFWTEVNEEFKEQSEELEPTQSEKILPEEGRDILEEKQSSKT
ncbi:hypothetical protein AKJ63_00400 [candidate division MSBL1 archaeon SCGC-AAA259D18]|uniref:Uncharacterized protein n=1 Tax=candidate division MSBL1 archaeon SCGC-AAA259D18 TaxID=1698262 RepID=A0A133UCL2_9EURY|nr:hypothetical protein AKJ63_00400 [candidate division MSBL1 archaeon SCGC-AAA259D18]